MRERGSASSRDVETRIRSPNGVKLEIGAWVHFLRYEERTCNVIDMLWDDEIKTKWNYHWLVWYVSLTAKRIN